MRLSDAQRHELMPDVVAQRTDPVGLRAPKAWEDADHRHSHTQRQRGGFVYVLRSEANGDIKIGFSRNVGARVAEHRAAHARPISLLLVLHGGHDLERALYLRFEAHRIRGEWFAPAEALLDWIAAVRRQVGAP